MPTNEYCMCRAVLSDWHDEYPFVRQGVMHSPVGCMRREMTLVQLQSLYRRLTSFDIYNNDLGTVYQAVMGQFAYHPEEAKAFSVTLVPRAQTPYRSYENLVEITPPLKRKRGVTTPVPPGSVQQKWQVVAPGPIKPPWEK